MFALNLPLCNTSSSQHPKRTRRRAAANGLVHVACSAAQLQPSQLQQHAHQAIQEGSLDYKSTVYQHHGLHHSTDHVVASNWNGALPTLLVIPPPDLPSVVSAGHHTGVYDSNLLRPMQSLQGEQHISTVREITILKDFSRGKQPANQEPDVNADEHIQQLSQHPSNSRHHQVSSVVSSSSASAVHARHAATQSLIADIKRCTSILQLAALCKQTQSQQPHLTRQPGVVLAAATTFHSILRLSHAAPVSLSSEEQEYTVSSDDRVAAADTDTASDVCRQHVRDMCNLLCDWVQFTAGKDATQTRRRHRKVANRVSAAFKPHQAVTILHALALGVKVGGPSACIPGSLLPLVESLLRCKPCSTQPCLNADTSSNSHSVRPSAIGPSLMPGQIATAAWSLATIGPQAVVCSTQHQQDGSHAAAALTAVLTWLYSVSEPVLGSLTAPQMTRLMWGLACFRASSMQQTQQHAQQQGNTLSTDHDDGAQPDGVAGSMLGTTSQPLLPGPGPSWWRAFEDVTIPYSTRSSAVAVNRSDMNSASNGVMQSLPPQHTDTATQRQILRCGLHAMPLTSLALCCWSASHLQCSTLVDQTHHMQQHQDQCQFPSESWVNALLGLVWAKRHALPDLPPVSVAQLMSGLDQLQYRAKPGLLGAIITRCSSNVSYHVVTSRQNKQHTNEPVSDLQHHSRRLRHHPEAAHNLTHTHVNGHSLQLGEATKTVSCLSHSLDNQTGASGSILLLEPPQSLAALALSSESIQPRPMYSHSSTPPACTVTHSRLKERHRSHAHPTRPLPLSQLVQVLRHAYQSQIHLPKSALHVLSTSFEVCLDSCTPAQLVVCAVWLHGCGCTHLSASIRPLWLAELHRGASQLTVGQCIQLLQLFKSWDIWPGSQWVSSFISATTPSLEHATMVQLQELLTTCLALGIRVQPSTTDVIQSIMTSCLQANHERSAVHLNDPHVHHDNTAVGNSQLQLDSMGNNSDYVLSGLDTWLTAIHTRMCRLQRKMSRTNQSAVNRGQVQSSTSTSHEPAAAAGLLSALLLQLCGCQPGTTLVSGASKKLDDTCHQWQLSQAQVQHTPET